MSEISKNQTEKEKEILSQLKARIEEIKPEMHIDYDIEYDDDDDIITCELCSDNLIQYEFWVEDGEIQYEIMLFDRWGSEYSVDGSNGRGYQPDQINEVADLLYNFAF